MESLEQSAVSYTGYSALKQFSHSIKRNAETVLFYVWFNLGLSELNSEMGLSAASMKIFNTHCYAIEQEKGDNL